jgi:hypothetical protein
MLDDIEIRVLIEINELMKKENFGGYIEIYNVYRYDKIEDINIYLMDMETM